VYREELLCDAGLVLNPTACHEVHCLIPFVTELNESHEESDDGEVSGNGEEDCHDASSMN
jgi:hypothetical protein